MPQGEGHAGTPGFRRLPQHEVHRIALVGRDVDAGAGLHLLEAAARQLAVVGHARDGEQHMLFRDVGVALGDQLLAQLAHLGDVIGGARLDGRRQHAERGNVLVELLGGLGGQLLDRRDRVHVGIALDRPRVDLVVDVGDVARIGDMAGAIDMPQQAEQQVEHDDRAGIADVGEVVDGRPAHIHAHVARIARRERTFGAGQRVVQGKRHEWSPDRMVGPSAT